MPIRITPEQARAMGVEVPTVKRKPKAKAVTKEAFALYCTTYGVPLAKDEHYFHDARGWRFDFAWPAEMVALEIEGGVWIQGRHSRGKGQIEDMAKYNAAALAGWVLLRCTPQQVKSGEVFETIKRALKS